MNSGINRLAALAALSEPLRKRAYDYAAGRAGGVTRDDVAAALGVARSVAAFHLEKLVDVGLLEVEQRRPPGRRGPGAGRPAKWYRRGGGEVSLSVPERRYDLAAALLATAAERSAPTSGALAEVAREHGQRIGAGLAGERAKPVTERLVETLAGCGYEPCAADGVITLRNCPFAALAAEHRQLVCGMNLNLLAGLAEAAGVPPGAAVLDPAPGRCCVTLAA